eukprot:g19475.t1
MASTGASAAANGSGSGPSSYTGKAHELIPEFSGKANDYKEYRKRVLLYERKMDLAGRKSEFAFNIMSSLKNRAWDACEDLSMEVLDSDTDMKEILQRLDAVFKYDAITELPQDFENFFIQMQRKRNETMQEYTANFERQLRRLAAHEVAHPEKVIGWYYLRRAGLSQQQRQLIMSTITTSTLSLDSVRKAVNFVIGQDQTPEGSAGRDTRFNKLKDTYIYNLADDSWSYEPEPDDAYYEDAESWEIGPEDSMSQILWHDEPAPPETDEEQVLMAMDAASEYDDIMANYVEARSKLNQLRVSRGYYPVVAMVPEQRNYTGVSVMFAQRREQANESVQAKAAAKPLFNPALADTVQAFFTRVVGCEVPDTQRRTGGFGVQHVLEEDRSKLILKTKYDCLKGERYRVVGDRGGPAGMWRLDGGKTIPKTHRCLANLRQEHRKAAKEAKGPSSESAESDDRAPKKKGVMKRKVKKESEVGKKGIKKPAHKRNSKSDRSQEDSRDKDSCDEDSRDGGSQMSSRRGRPRPRSRARR